MTSTTTSLPSADTLAPTPTERLLDGSLAVAPLLYLVADTTYAVRGWDDPTAGVLHVVAALGYAFVVLAVAGWLPRSSRLAAAIVLTGVIGAGGDLAYGFETIHASLGDVALVDQPGAANLIKPLGLFFPLSFALVAGALARLGHRWQAVLVLASIVAWPIAHIGDVAAVAVPVNVALTVAFGSLVWARRPAQPSSR